MIALLTSTEDLSAQDFTSLLDEVREAQPATRAHVWSDDQLLTQLDSRIGRERYLDLLCALQPFHYGILAEDGSRGHSQDDVDRMISERLPSYAPGLQQDMSQRGIRGRLGVVADADWQRVTEQHPHRRSHAKSNAFVNGKGRIWVHKDRGNRGTILHEGIHRWSSPDQALYVALGPSIVEGMTEWFTRAIAKDEFPHLTRTNYQRQYLIVDRLVSVCGPSIVAAAYFGGDVATLEATCVQAGVHWSAFAGATRVDRGLDDRRFAVAMKALGRPR